MFLQSNDEVKSIARFDKDSGSYELLESDAHELQSIKTSGFFSILNDEFVAMYIQSNRICLAIGDFSTTLSEQTQVSRLSIGNRKILKVSVDNKKMFEFTYSIKSKKKAFWDLTPFVEDEDFDFGLFVENISKSTARQNAMIESHNASQSLVNDQGIRVLENGTNGDANEIGFD